MRSTPPALRVLVIVGALVGAFAGTGHAAAQGDAVLLSSTAFDWKDVVEDMATFEWSVDVLNNSDQTLRLRIIFEVLDDDDTAVNRDEQGNPNDIVIITIEPGQTVPVRQQGGLSYDQAAEVVTYRHRWEIIQGRR